MYNMPYVYLTLDLDARPYLLSSACDRYQMPLIVDQIDTVLVASLRKITFMDPMRQKQMERIYDHECSMCLCCFAYLFPRMERLEHFLLSGDIL